MTDIQDFFDECDEIAQHILGASHEYVPQHFRRLFAVFREAPEPIARRISWLQGLDIWHRQKDSIIREASGMVGSGQLLFPDDKVERLSAHLGMYREIADEKIDLFQFAHEFFYVRSNNIDELVQEFLRKIFVPFQNELERYLRQNLDNPAPEASSDIPAADRTVSIDHNSRSVKEAIEAIDDVTKAIDESNSLPPEIKGQAKAEVNALRALLNASVVSLKALGALLSSTLATFAIKFRDTAFGMASGYVIAKAIEAWPAIVAVLPPLPF